MWVRQVTDLYGQDSSQPKPRSRSERRTYGIHRADPGRSRQRGCRLSLPALRNYEHNARLADTAGLLRNRYRPADRRRDRAVIEQLTLATGHENFRSRPGMSVMLLRSVARRI